MREVFGPGGRLAETLGGFEPRGEQEAFAAAVADAIEREEHLVAEAGTGTGKSLGYLVPLLAAGRRAVVATATKALQAQLVERDVPAAAAALGRAVDCVLLKGRENYLCQRALQGLALLGASDALFRSSADAAQYEQLRDWIETTVTGDRAELDVEPSPTLWSDLAVGGDRCLGRACEWRDACFSEAVRERAGRAKLVVTNHALYLADVALRARGPGRDASVLPPHDVVVFDEAHRLEDAACTWLGGRVSLSGLRRLARDVERSAREQGRPAPARPLAELDRLGPAVIERIEPPRGRRRLRAGDIEAVRAAVDALAGALRSLAGALAGAGEEADLNARRAALFADDLDVCLELPRGVVVWAEPAALAWAPVDVSGVLRDELWESGATAVLVSATLRVPSAGDDSSGRELAFVAGRLGLGEERELVVASPFDYAEQALLYLPGSFPDPRSAGYLARVAEEAAALCVASRGRALVLTTSYRALDAIAPRLAEELPYRVLCQGEAPRERLLERFREDVDSVLVATQTFWQGVDVPGEALSLLVIDKLPFAPPDDPLVEARCELVSAAGGDWFSGYSLPSAVLALRQGFGRLIRSREDRGVVAILDPRLRTRAYGRLFLESLPRCPRTSDRGAVERFLSGGGQIPD